MKYSQKYDQKYCKKYDKKIAINTIKNAAIYANRITEILLEIHTKIKPNILMKIRSYTA